jgi:hypothetical protein
MIHMKHTTKRGRMFMTASFSVASACILMVRFIIVFLPIKTTESPRRPERMLWSCFEPTLSAWTIRTWEYWLSKAHSFLSYNIFFSALEGFTAIS